MRVVVTYGVSAVDVSVIAVPTMSADAFDLPAGAATVA